MKKIKSGKQRRLEIKAKRLNKPLKTKLRNSVKADHTELAHNNTLGLFPSYYYDKDFVCYKCGIKEVWLAEQQKYWYEVIKGSIFSTAQHCLKCRKAIREEKKQQKAHMETMAERPPHPHEAFFKKRFR